MPTMPVLNLDHVPMHQRRDIHPTEQVHNHGGAQPRQVLDDWRFKEGWPGNGHEKEADRKCQLPQPATTPACINRTQREADGDDAE